MNSGANSQRIGLALSGGGIRAAAYHAGVLRWLAEKGWLEQTSHISSVSGGSLFAGLVFHVSGNLWPTSKQYNDEVFQKVRDLLVNQSLQADGISRLLLRPWNWRFLISRANVLAKSIEALWEVTGTLGDLPQNPVWSINAATAESGRRSRFKNGTLGDYEIGYTDAAGFKLSEAIAVSAAFPGGIGPLLLHTNKYKWFKKKEWDSTEPPELTTPAFEKLHFYDGGLYDNLGIEPLFDVGKQAFKKNEPHRLDFLIVSDAGAPFIKSSIPGQLNPSRFKRIAEIAYDQTRALRVRSFINFLKNNNSAGMYLQIGSVPKDKIQRYSKHLIADDLDPLLSLDWLSPQDVLTAASYPTDLKGMTSANFDLLARHGYETSEWNDLVRKELL